MSSSVERTVFYTINSAFLIGIALFQISGAKMLCDALFVERCNLNATELMRLSSIATAFWAIHVMMEVRYAYATVLACIVAFGSSVLYAFTDALKMEARIALAIIGGVLAMGYTFFDLYHRRNVSVAGPSVVQEEGEEGVPEKPKRSRRDIMSVA